MDNVDGAACVGGVSSNKVIDHKNDKIANRNECDDRCVFQAVEPAQERKGYHNEPVILSVASRKVIGQIAHMNAVTQKCLSTR